MPRSYSPGRERLLKAFDTDILTEILTGNPAYAERIAQVPLVEQAAPIVAVEEIIRGRLNVIRQRWRHGMPSQRAPITSLVIGARAFSSFAAARTCVT